MSPSVGGGVGGSYGIDRLSDVPGFRLLRHTGRSVAASALPLDLIHRSAWKGNSANFAFHDFSEVAPALLTLHTGHVDQLKAGPTGPALSDKEVG